MVFVGGKLSLKGDKKKKGKKKKSKSKHDKKKSSRDEEAAAFAAANSGGSDDEEDELTEAERRSQKFKGKAERKDLEKAAKQSHRDRVEEFSQKLSELTELNDIPRVSFITMRMRKQGSVTCVAPSQQKYQGACLLLLAGPNSSDSIYSDLLATYMSKLQVPFFTPCIVETYAFFIAFFSTHFMCQQVSAAGNG